MQLKTLPFVLSVFYWTAFQSIPLNAQTDFELDHLFTYKASQLQPYEDYSLCMVGFKDSTNNIVLPPQFTWAELFYIYTPDTLSKSVSGSVAWLVSKDGKMGILDANGTNLLPTIYDRISVNLAAWHDSPPPNIFGIVHQKGKKAVYYFPKKSMSAFAFDEVTCPGTSFSNNLRLKVPTQTCFYRKKKHWGVIDSSFAPIFAPTKQFQITGHIDRDYYSIRPKDGQSMFGIIDKKGAEVMPLGVGKIKVANYDTTRAYFWRETTAGPNDIEYKIFEGIYPLKYAYTAYTNIPLIKPYQVIDSGGYYGCLKYNGEEVLPLKFKLLFPFYKNSPVWPFKKTVGFIASSNEDSLGLLSLAGDTLIPFEHAAMSQLYGMVLTEKNSLYALYSRNNTLLIEGCTKITKDLGGYYAEKDHYLFIMQDSAGFVKYDSAHFNFPNAIQTINNKYLINKSGLIIKDNIHGALQTVGNCYMIKSGRNRQLISKKTGKVVFNTNEFIRYQTKGNLAIVQTQNRKVGIFDWSTQQYLLPPEYKTLYDLHNHFWASKSPILAPGNCCNPKGEWHLFGRFGERLTEMPMDYPAPFVHNIGIISVNGKKGIMETSGRIPVAPQFTWIERPNSHPYQGRVRKDGKWGFINTSYKILEPRFTQLVVFQDLLFGFSGNGAITVLDKNYKTLAQAESVDSLIQNATFSKLLNFQYFFPPDTLVNYNKDRLLLYNDIYLSFPKGVAAYHKIANYLLLSELKFNAFQEPEKPRVFYPSSMFPGGDCPKVCPSPSTTAVNKRKARLLYADATLFSEVESVEKGSINWKNSFGYPQTTTRMEIRNFYLQPFGMQRIALKDLLDQQSGYEEFLYEKLLAQLTESQVYGFECLDVAQTVNKAMENFYFSSAGLVFFLGQDSFENWFTATIPFEALQPYAKPGGILEQYQ